MFLRLENSAQFAIVDDNMADELAQSKWYLVDVGGKLYVRGHYPVSGRREWLHHIAAFGTIMQFYDGRDTVDHANGDTLDNRRDNLRLCTAAQNQMNSIGQRRRLSRFKGVSPGRGTMTGKWKASICRDGKDRHLGYFTTEEEAGRAYDREARILFGSFARLNFPD